VAPCTCFTAPPVVGGKVPCKRTRNEE